MNFTLLDTLQTTFIIVVSIIVGALLLIIILIPIIKHIQKKKYHELSYFKIKDVVLNNDYYLLNNFRFKIDESKTILIDHIIGADKYFYVIEDYFYKKGSLTGNINDQALIYIDNKGVKKYTENPVIDSKRVLSKLSRVTGISPSMLIGIVLVNDSCIVDISSESKQFYVIRKKQLAPLIKAIESRNVNNIVSSQMENVFKILDQNNIKKD